VLNGDPPVFAILAKKKFDRPVVVSYWAIMWGFTKTKLRVIVRSNERRCRYGKFNPSTGTENHGLSALRRSAVA